jgi:transcriptional regulator with XRE-family HTH domain
MNPNLYDLKEIGRRMLEIRKHLGLTQADLGSELDVSNSTISEMEAGNGKPGFEILFNLSKKYNIDTDYALHGRGTMFRTGNNPASISEFFPKEHAQFVEKAVGYLKTSELVRFSFLNYFKRYLLQNKKLIEMELEQEKNPGFKDRSNELD